MDNGEICGGALFIAVLTLLLSGSAGMSWWERTALALFQFFFWATIFLAGDRHQRGIH